MYLDSHDYQTIWSLAHNWTNLEPESTDQNNLPSDTKIAIHRIMSAILGSKLTVRNKTFQIFLDDSFLNFIFDFSHYRKFSQCLKRDVFNKSYLDSLYVKRPDVIAWCQSDFLTIPSIWQLRVQDNLQNASEYDASEDENEGWYADLSDRRKQRVACLEMAKKLWLINPSQTYEEIYNHSTMKLFGNPNVFSLDAFRKWSRPFATEYAKTGGRPIKNK